MVKRGRVLAALGWFALVIPSAGAAQVPGGGAGTGVARATVEVPGGLGTLRQDEITVSLRSGALLVKVTPLAEEVIRLAAPDTYRRLHELVERRKAEVAERAGVAAPQLFLVSFFSYEPDVSFQPEDLQLSYQGRLLRPLAIVPVTPGWGKQRLQQQETQLALYAFSPELVLDQPFVVRYGFEQSDQWTRILPRLEVERTRVLSRAGR
jgi:hypothetical protein